ncbi:MAG: GAF domain-containing protein [Deltaproteobacteria bacterium]|nr:GAF domain-containing protein [Deltaproteobacteria bacterium]
MPTDAAKLRRLAEERLREKPPAEVGQATLPTLEDAQRLVHELQVHQIELELQNEELEGARDEAEAALERYTELYDFAPVGYVTLGRDGTIRKTNLAGARILRVDRSRLVGGRFGLFVANDSRARFNAFLESVFEKEGREACDVAIRTESDEPLWTHLEGVASEDGQECRAVLTDITERQRLEEILHFRMALLEFAPTHTLEELIQKTLDQLGALTGSPIGFYHFVEPDQTTISLQAWSTRTIKEFCSAEGLGRHYPLDQAGVWADCVRERRPVIHNDYATLPNRRGLPEGHAKVIREVVVPIMRQARIVAVAGVGNKPTEYTDRDVKVVSFLADVAWAMIERKRADEALREADRNKDQFLAMLSHELRNPLAPVRNSLYVMDRAAPGSGQAKRARAVIDRQVGQLTRLIDDLLDVTRIARGKVRLEREPFDLREVVLRAADDHRPAFAANGLTLTVSVPDETVSVDGDRSRLMQVVGNLLNNAAKFTQRGGRTRIVLHRDAQAAQAVIRVRDTGAGIAPEMLPRLFDAFVQADRTLDRSRTGLGLGLALAKGLVEVHGGSIAVHSDGLGQGAEFTIRLPFGEGAPAAATVAGEARTRAPRRVLVIEDNVDAADSLREALELEDHEVAVAYDGPGGVRMARELRPEVVLCDIGLPGMDGYEVARAFRSDAALRSTHLVALTGYALPEDVAKAKEAGFDAHLAKPPTMEKIEEALAVPREPTSLDLDPRAR